MIFAMMLSAGIRVVRLVIPARHIIIQGYYGTGNIGDEAILVASLAEIRRVTTLEPLVFAWDPKVVEARHGVRSLDPRRTRRWRVLWALCRSGGFVLGGGGLVKDYGGSPASLERWLRWIDLAARAGIPTMTWAIGVEHVVYPESKRRVAEVLGRVTRVTVRDEGSAARLRALGVHGDVRVTGDPAALLVTELSDERLISAGRRVVVCLRHWFATDRRIEDEQVFERVLGEVAAACDELQGRHGFQITFLPFRTTVEDDDQIVAERVIARMACREGVEVLPLRETPLLAMEELSRADVVLTMRLHAAILAVSLGIPVVALAYMPKVSDQMDEIGQAANCLEMEDVSVAELVPRVLRLATSRHGQAEEMRALQARQRQRAAETGNELRALLPDRYRRGTSWVVA